LLFLILGQDIKEGVDTTLLERPEVLFFRSSQGAELVYATLKILSDLFVHNDFREQASYALVALLHKPDVRLHVFQNLHALCGLTRVAALDVDHVSSYLILEPV